MTTAPSRPSPHTAALPKRIFNFSAGPAVLPESVLLQARDDLWSIDGSGIGILEHSHRGKVFDRVIADAEASCRAVGSIPDDHRVLFLQGGATTQFAMIPMNFLAKDATADYINTGVWTKKAIAEAKKLGSVHVAFDGAACDFDHTPADDELTYSPNPAYVHYCSNNTIYGTRFSTPPATTPPPSTAPLIVDASSEMFSRPIDFGGHALVYAGAQKNLGPSGLALVIVKDELLERCPAGLPTMFDYQKHAAKGSRLNTPPTFGIYVCGLVFRWIQDQGGLAQIAKNNDAKAQIIYDAIDGSGGFYQPVARPACRSVMNITFRTPSPEADKAFVEEALANDMSGLKGHRDVGGLRASVYNAFPVEGCRVLADFMAAFAQKNG